MKITRKQIKRLIERVAYGPGLDISDLQTAKDYETLAVSSILKKKDQYTLLHNMTKKVIAGNQLLVNISNWLANYKRPSAVGGNSIDPGSLTIDTINGLPCYSFCTSTDTNAPNADNNFNNLFSGALNQASADQIINDCLSTPKSKTPPWPDNSGEKIEPALALIMAAINPGECYAALQTSSAGKDLIHVGSNEYFELKYSDSEKGRINDDFSASPPTVHAKDKYIIFLSSDRSYFIHTPLLARIVSVGSDIMPSQTDHSANTAFNTKLLFYLIEQPEVRDTCLEASRQVYQSSLDHQGEYTPKNDEYLLDQFISSINRSQKKDDCIDALRTLFVINNSKTPTGRKYKGKASSISLASRGTQEHLEDTFNNFLDASNSELLSVSSILAIPNYGQFVYQSLSYLLQNLAIAWGFNQMDGLVVFPAMQVVTAEEGGPSSYQRIVGKASSGKNYEDVLSPTYTASSLSAKANLIFNIVNNPEVPSKTKESVLNLLKGIDDTGAMRQSSVYLKTVNAIKADSQAMSEIIIELMRGATGRSLVIEHVLLAHFRKTIRQTSIPGFKEFNKALGKRSSHVLSSYINNIASESSGRENDFWTNFDRDNPYDDILFDIFVKDNINNSLNVFFSDNTFSGFIQAAVEGISEITKNLKGKVTRSIKDKNIDDRIESFKKALTTTELQTFVRLRYPDKVSFMADYARQNRIPHPLRSQQIAYLSSPMLDPEEMEIYSETKLYESILRELLKHSK